MKLILMRHAKSDWDHPSLPDHDRHLSPRGERAAEAMKAALSAEGFRADQVLSSTATRAATTAAIALDGLSPPPEFLAELYLASPHEMLALIRSADPSAKTLALVGHNPGTHSTAFRLCATGLQPDLDRLYEKFPTGALAEIAFDAERWEDVNWGTGTLTRFLRPKDLPDADRLRL